jgi:hypothetical protein
VFSQLQREEGSVMSDLSTLEIRLAFKLERKEDPGKTGPLNRKEKEIEVRIFCL